MNLTQKYKNKKFEKNDTRRQQQLIESLNMDLKSQNNSFEQVPANIDGTQTQRFQNSQIKPINQWLLESQKLQNILNNELYGLSLSILKKQVADVNKSFDSGKPVVLTPMAKGMHKESMKNIENSNSKINASLDVGKKVSNFNLSHVDNPVTAQREMSASQRS